MNDRLIKLLKESPAVLNLNEKQSNYLDMLVNFAYNQGVIDGMQQVVSDMKSVNQQSFQEEYEEVRQK